MKQIKTLGFLSVFAVLGFASLTFILQKQQTQYAKAAPGDVVVTITRAGDNQTLSNANVQVNCPSTGNSIVLVETPANSGTYVGSFIGQCNTGNAINASISVQGYVDQAGLNFANPYNDGIEPDCPTSQNCLQVTNFQPGVLVNLQDTGATPITGGTVSGASVNCYEAPGGVYLCPEPEGAGCPVTDTANASASGFIAGTGDYNRRCTGNTAQSQITIQLAVDPNPPGDGGGFFNILQRQELEEETAPLPTPSSPEFIETIPPVQIQLEALSLQSVDPIQVCPFFSDSRGGISTEGLFTNTGPLTRPLWPMPNQFVEPGFFQVPSHDGTIAEEIRYQSIADPSWGFEIRHALYVPNGPLISTTEYLYRVTDNNTFFVERVHHTTNFDPITLVPAELDLEITLDQSGSIQSSFPKPVDFSEELLDKLRLDSGIFFIQLNYFPSADQCTKANIPEPIPSPLPEKTDQTRPPDFTFSVQEDDDTIVVDCRLEAQGISSVLGSTTSAAIETFLFSKLFAPGITSPGDLPLDLVYFIACDEETSELGLGERIGVVNSFSSTFNRIPLSTADWIDVLLIAHGSEPLQTASAKKQDNAKSMFVKLFGRQANLNDPRDTEKLDQLIYGIRPLQRDLDKEYGAVLEFESIFSYSPSSNADWNAVRALAYGSDVIDLNDLDRQLDAVRNSLQTGPCTEEEIAALNAQKAVLEAEAASLMSKQSDLKGEIKACNDAKDGMETNKNNEQTKADEAGKKADQAQQEIDKANGEITDLEQDIANLQEILTGGDNVETTTSSSPLDGISSGAAITFDGGATWVVATGEAGAQQLSENLASNPGIVQDLQNKKTELDQKKADKQQAEQDKAKAEQDKADAEQKKADIEQQIEAKKQDTAKKAAELDAIGAAIDALNAKIAEFNAVAAKCEIAAAAAERAASERLDEAKRTLDKMPPEDKEAAEQEFEENATDAEKDADVDAGYAGGAADDAAEKLKEAMRNASGCTNGAKKCGETFTSRRYVSSGTEGWFQTLLFLRGGGLDGDQKYNDMVNEIQDSFDNVDTGEKLGLALTTTIDALAGGSILNIGIAIPGLVYGAWTDIARQAALNKIAEIRQIVPNPAIDGDLFFYGGWDKYVKDTWQKDYICEDGIWQYNGNSLIATATECEYKDPALEIVSIPDANLPDYSEKDDGNWRNPDSLQKFSEWRGNQLEEHQPFGPCQETSLTFAPSCG